MKPEDVRECVSAAKDRSKINQIKVVPSNQAEKATYFSKQSLINCLSAVDFEVRAASVASDPLKTMDFVAEFLDARKALERHFDISVDPTDTVLGILPSDPDAAFSLGAPAWQRSKKLGEYQAIQGFLKDEDGTVLYVGRETTTGLSFAEGEWRLMEKQEGVERFKEHCTREITAHSNKDMQLFCTYATEQGRIVEFPHQATIKLTAADEQTLKEGKPLTPDHALSRALSTGENHVLFSTPYMEKQSSALSDADAFAFSLRKAYPEPKQLRDPLSPKTSELTRKVSEFGVATPDVLVVLPEDPKAVPQGMTIQNILAELKAANIETVVFKENEHYKGKKGRAVFVITGHSSMEMEDFVRKLGEAGYLKDNYVVFNSCGTELNRGLIAEINGRFGAVGTFGFEGEISGAAVQDYLVELVESLKAKAKVNFMEILGKFTRKHNLTGIFTVCSHLHTTKHVVHNI